MGFLSSLANIGTGGLFGLGKDIFNGIQANNALTRAGTQQLNANAAARQGLTTAQTTAEGTLRSGQEQGYGAQFDALQGIDQAWSPYQQVGQQSLMGLNDAANAQTQFRAPSADDIKGQLDPSMQFTMDEGLKALQRSAAGRGRLNSGGTLKDINTFAQGLASTNYGNAYSRAYQNSLMNYQSGMENQANRFQRLNSLGQMGYNATANENAARENFGNQTMALDERTGVNIANSQLGLGNAMGDLSLREGQVRADQTMGKVGNVIGSVNNGLYDLSSMGLPRLGGGRVGPGIYSSPRTIDPNAEIYS